MLRHGNHARPLSTRSRARLSISCRRRAISCPIVRRRSVRVRGIVEEVSQQEADQYFASRPRDSRIGAWASQQSRPLESRFALETAVALNTAKYAIGEVPRPSHWSGFRIMPLSIEFWHDRPFRLHDRVVFRRPEEASGWTKARLYP